MPNAEALKDACEYVAKMRLKKVAVLNYLGENTRAYNKDRVDRAMKARGPEGQQPSRARVVMGESQKIGPFSGTDGSGTSESTTTRSPAFGAHPGGHDSAWQSATSSGTETKEISSVDGSVDRRNYYIHGSFGECQLSLPTKLLSSSM